MRIAVCTMMFNEPEFLPIWLRYYGASVGPENCFVIDHTSDTFHSSILNIRNLIHIARSPQDEVQRVNALSDFTGYLLNYYDVVIYTDIDEILVPNPDIYQSLADFCERNVDAVITAVGLNLQHLTDDEPVFNFSSEVMVQRRFVRFVSAMCKPSIIRTRVKWTRGFHGCNYPVNFKEIYLIHLRNFDLSSSLRRLARTRQIPRRTVADELGAAHQRIDDDQAEKWMTAAARMPKKVLHRISLDEDPLRILLNNAAASDPTKLRIDINATELWELPKSFVGIF